MLEQTGAEPVHASALRQLLDLGFPFTLGEQGRSFGGRSGGDADDTAGRAERGFVDDPLSVERLGDLGRAAQATIGSLDPGLELAQGTTSYVYLGARIVRGWAIQLVLLTALLPFLIGAVDLFARCRRRRIKLAPAARSLRSRIAFWAYAGFLVLVAARLGAFPDGEARPLPPGVDVYQPPAVVLGVLAALLVAGWLVARQPLIPADRPGSRRPWPVTPSLCSRSP